MRAALELGHWTFGVPVGYIRKSNAIGKETMEPDPVAGPLIQTAFELYANGDLTKAEILRKLTAMGLRTRRGKPLTAQAFQALLRNPIYAGIISVPNWEIEGIKGDFHPLISLQTFQRVQAVFTGRALQVRSHVRNHPDFPLRRFARCAACDRPLTGSWSKGRSDRYAYYRCRTSGCLSIKITKDELERQFLEFLTRLRPKTEYVELFRAVVEDLWKSNANQAKAATGAIRDNIQKLQDKRQQLMEAHVYAKTLDRELYQREDGRLSTEIALAQIELHDAELEEIDIEGVLNFATSIILDARRLWAEGSLEQRQRLQDALFPSGVVYSDQTGFGTTETSLFFRCLAIADAKNAGLASPTGFEPAQAH
jgi:hypothetical protein